MKTAVIDLYEEVIRQHALSPARFAQLVYAYFGDLPENVGPCIKNTESLSKIICSLPDREYIRIQTSGQLTNTDLLFETGTDGDTPYRAVRFLRGICTIFKQSVFQFYKAKKQDYTGTRVTIVLAVYEEGKPVYFGDLNATSLS